MSYNQHTIDYNLITLSFHQKEKGSLMEHQIGGIHDIRMKGQLGSIPLQ